MKRLLCLILLCAMAMLTGCAQDMNYIISHEDHFAGIVEQISDNGTKETEDDRITVRVNQDDPLYAGFQTVLVSLDAENGDSMTHFSLGDEVEVYYDGIQGSSGTATLNRVFAVLLIEPADRAENNVS